MIQLLLVILIAIIALSVYGYLYYVVKYQKALETCPKCICPKTEDCIKKEDCPQCPAFDPEFVKHMKLVPEHNHDADFPVHVHHPHTSEPEDDEDITHYHTSEPEDSSTNVELSSPSIIDNVKQSDVIVNDLQEFEYDSSVTGTNKYEECEILCKMCRSRKYGTCSKICSKCEELKSLSYPLN
tara:strand:- start:9674 stop:10222 length:549 start_codon:yes stop_codon:yes gene_type:complete